MRRVKCHKRNLTCIAQNKVDTKQRAANATNLACSMATSSRYSMFLSAEGFKPGPVVKEKEKGNKHT